MKKLTYTTCLFGDQRLYKKEFDIDYKKVFTSVAINDIVQMTITLVARNPCRID